MCHVPADFMDVTMRGAPWGRSPGLCSGGRRPEVSGPSGSDAPRVPTPSCNTPGPGAYHQGDTRDPAFPGWPSACESLSQPGIK